MNETFFISHGSPTISIDESSPARRFLKSWKDSVFGDPHRKPKSILIVSAHWDTSQPTVTSTAHRHDTIHDFYGFPEPMYQLKYPAPGAPKLAKWVKDLLQGSGFEGVVEDRGRGLDHGAWIPLMLMYPEGDIPVCQLSVQTHRDAAHHYRMGRALAPLKEEGVLIIGSGSATHNLRSLRPDRGDGKVEPWASEFIQWLNSSLLGGRYKEVNEYLQHAPHAKKAHPWPEHLYPLHVAMGAAGEDFKAELIHDSWEFGALSYASYRFVGRGNP